MKRSDYIIWIGMAAAAGAAVGSLAGRKHPAKSGLLGAAAGAIAGSFGCGGL